MARKIFISHQRSDTVLATKVASRVQFNGVPTYLDVIDDALVKDGPDLADILLERISKCDQLIAVVSTETKGSWWVPWEIGVGSEKGFRMASYSDRYVMLPSYLEKWPDLHGDADIDLFCKLSDKADVEIQNRFRTVLTEDRKLEVRKSGATDFHKELRLGLARLRR